MFSLIFPFKCIFNLQTVKFSFVIYSSMNFNTCRFIQLPPQIPEQFYHSSSTPTPKFPLLPLCFQALPSSLTNPQPLQLWICSLTLWFVFSKICKWNHTVCSLWVSLFSQRGALESHPGCVYIHPRFVSFHFE